MRLFCFVWRQPDASAQQPRRKTPACMRLNARVVAGNGAFGLGCYHILRSLSCAYDCAYDCHTVASVAFFRSVSSVLSSDSHHIDILRRGPRAWNAWRAQNPAIKPQLMGIALKAAERQMGPINGGPINLSGARLRHSSLRFATLSGADLSGADLSDTDLSEARLNGANLAGADLTEALLDQADFAGASLAGANLSGTNLLGVRNLTQAQIDEARGNLMTVLPPHLSRPRSWTGTVSQVFSAPQPRAVPEPEPAEPAPFRSRNREPAPQIRGERVSWLVGGPRSGEARARDPQGA